MMAPITLSMLLLFGAGFFVQDQPALCIACLVGYLAMWMAWSAA